MPEPAEPSSANSGMPSLGELFVSFVVVSVSGFGGALPWARRMIVEHKRGFVMANAGVDQSNVAPQDGVARVLLLPGLGAICLDRPAAGSKK